MSTAYVRGGTDRAYGAMAGYKVAGTGGSSCRSRYRVRCDDGAWDQGGQQCVPIDCSAAGLLPALPALMQRRRWRR
eukprot:2136778-Rhodomonas_salina.3